MTSFSIVIPVHNRAHTLSKCVDSILAQSYKDFELILVDDHSSDNSVELAKSYAEKDERVRVIEQPEEKRGAQAARNAGILAAKFDWIMFNDSDDTWSVQKIEKELKILEQHNYNPKLVIYSDCNTVKTGTKDKQYWALPDISEDNSYRDLLVTSGPMFQSLLCSKKHLEEIGLLDESVPSYQEWDTSIRLAKNGNFIHIKEALFDYEVGAEDAISKSAEKDFIGRCNIYNKFAEEIINVHGIKKFKRMIAENLLSQENLFFFNNLKSIENNSEKSLTVNKIISLYENNLIKAFGTNYIKKAAKYIEDPLIKKFLRKIKRFIKSCIKFPFSFIKRILYQRNALKTKTPVLITPLSDRSSKQYLYQLSFFAEFFQYFKTPIASIPKSHGKQKMLYDLDMAYFPLEYDYDTYFNDVIKSDIRKNIRKALKNEFTCKEINYDDYLEEIHLINTSKEFRQGVKMTGDYVSALKPRQSLVTSVGQTIHTFGCFTKEGKLAAYMMYELYGDRIFHTVKILGHADYLTYGVMNYLFAFAQDALHILYGKDFVILYGGMSMNDDGLSRFKRNLGFKQGCLTICAENVFYKDLDSFNKKYKIHGDTGLNFISDYLQ